MARNTVLSRTHNIYRNLHMTGLLASLFPCNYQHQPSTFTSLFGDSCKVCSQRFAYVLLRERRCFHASGCTWIHAGRYLRDVFPEPAKDSKPGNASEDGASVALGVEKVKRKKLKGKRAVVRWLKSFRWRKKKEYERMTAEDKILYKLKKARNREDRLVAALKKIDPPDTTETTHDPEILTPEEHFYFLKMGHKARNYVPIGRRGIYQGVILNMHLHWKKHQTLKVKVKTFTPEEVREIAAELARLSGGIVLEIHEENTIIMYRGKNYVQPPTEIMSPKVTLPRKKALDKSKYRDALRAVRQFIPRLEQNLELLKEQHKRDTEDKNLVMAEEPLRDSGSSEDIFKLAELLELKKNDDGVLSADDSLLEPSKLSESEDLSDIFETDSEGDYEEKEVKPLYLDEIERFPSQNVKEPENFEEHLRKISTVSKNSSPSGKNVEMLELDEIDKLFLQAGSLLKKKRR